MRAGRTLLGAALGIAAVTVVARAVGFGRVAVFSATVGLDCLGSTYTVANALPNVVFEVVAGGALASLVVPVLSPALAAGDRATASRTLSVLLTWTVLVLVPVVLAGLALAPVLVRALLGADPVCGPRALEVGTSMLRVFLPQVVLYGVAVVLTGALQASHRFLAPALAPLLSSLVVAGAYLLYAAGGRQDLAGLSRASELVLSVGTTLGVAVLALSVVVPLRRTGLRLRPALTLPPGLGPRVRGLALAGVAALTAQQVALVVALRLAAGAAPGAPAVFSVATSVFLLPWAVLAVPVATSAFPRLAAAGDREYADTARRTLRLVLVLTLAGAAVLAATALPAARLLGAGPAAPELAAALRAFAPGLVGYGLVALLGRALYARGAGRTAGAATVAGWLAVAGADVVLVLATPLPAAVALGLGNALGMTVAALLLVRGLAAVAPDALAGTGRTVLVGAGAALLAGLAPLALPDPPPGAAGALLAAAGLAVLAAGAVAAALALADRGALADVRASLAEVRRA